jgi:DNA-binding MarR family transcriptional regulator
MYPDRIMAADGFPVEPRGRQKRNTTRSSGFREGSAGRRAATGPFQRTLSPVTTEWLSDDEQGVWRALLSVEARLQDRLDQELRRAHDLSVAEYGVLVHLSEGDGDGMRMSELAERLLISRSGLTRRIDAMVRAGLVERRACPADGRGSMARLTPAGAAKLTEAAPTHVAGVRRYLMEPLADRLDGLAEGLERVATALDKEP